MRRLLAIGIFSMALMTLAACGGGGIDGGWVVTGSDGAYYLQINNGTGTVDHAYTFNGKVSRVYGTLLLHNDGTIEVDGMVDGALKDCSACPYQLSNGNLIINYTYQSYTGSGPVSGTMTLSPGDVSAYQKDVQSLTP